MDTQALLDLCRINEEAPDFDLGSWTCGTFGCLAGNFCLARRGDLLRLYGQTILFWEDCGVEAVAKRFGLTSKEGVFLFAAANVERDKFGMPYYYPPRPRWDRAAAIARVRKLIYWKLKRREFMYEDDGRVRESARRMEGDRHFAREAVKAAREAERTPALV